MSDPLALLVALGARTPLGLDAQQTGLLHRTGIPAVAAAPLGEDGVAMCFQPALDSTLEGVERAALLAQPALDEALVPLSAIAKARTRLVLCLDAVHGAGGERNTIASRLYKTMTRSFPDATLELHACDEGGALRGLAGAIDALGRGRLDLVVLGGVHTDFDRRIIAALIDQGRLCTPDAVGGRLPGEAACFVVLASSESSRRLRLDPLGAIIGLGSAMEAARHDNDEPAAAARGLTRALRDAAAPWRAAGIRAGWMLTDLGFEQHRLLEWQSAFVRSHDVLGAPYYIDAPAQRMGHAGAATWPLHAVLACEAWRGGYAPSPRALTTVGGDDGLRGASLLAAL